MKCQRTNHFMVVFWLASTFSIPNLYVWLPWHDITVFLESKPLVLWARHRLQGEMWIVVFLTAYWVVGLLAWEMQLLWFTVRIIRCDLTLLLKLKEYCKSKLCLLQNSWKSNICILHAKNNWYNYYSVKRKSSSQLALEFGRTYNG